MALKLKISQNGSTVVLQEVKQSQTQTVPKAPMVAITTELDPVINEYIDLYIQAEEMQLKKIYNRMEILRKQLASNANEMFSEDEQAVFKSDHGSIVFSPRSQSTVIPKAKELIEYMVEKVGEEAAYATVDFTIKQLLNLLSENELKKFSDKVPGARTVKAVLPAIEVG